MNWFDDKPKVLLAEDTAVGRKVVARILSDAGCQVTAVADGQAVLDMLAGSRFDLVIMDCMMPEMDGFEASRAIRAGAAGEGSATVPIIAMTGLASVSDRQKCIDAGMDDYVQKPVGHDNLVTTINAVLALRKTDSEKAASKALQEEEENLLKSLDDWSPGFMDNIINQFLEDVPEDIESLQQALENEDMEGLRVLAHRLRGSADVLSANTLSSRARALEKACAERQPELARQLAPELILELDKMLKSHE